jgi:hypothetical protein
MDYSLALLLSVLFINGVHGWLLYYHRGNRKWSISEHAVLDKKSYFFYVLGHLLGGAFWLVFAKIYFVDTVHLDWLFALSIWVVGFEYLQALLPAKGKINKLHTIAALIMWGSFIAAGLLCIAFLPAGIYQKYLASVLYACLFSVLIYASSHRQKIYKYQMTMVILFQASIFVLVS